MPDPAKSTNSFTNDELEAIANDAAEATSYDDAWQSGYNIAMKSSLSAAYGKSSGKPSFMDDFLTYLIGGLTLYTIVLLVSAGWHDGKG